VCIVNSVKIDKLKKVRLLACTVALRALLMRLLAFTVALRALLALPSRAIPANSCQPCQFCHPCHPCHPCRPLPACPAYLALICCKHAARFPTATSTPPLIFCSAVHSHKQRRCCEHPSSFVRQFTAISSVGAVNTPYLLFGSSQS